MVVVALAVGVAGVGVAIEVEEEAEAAVMAASLEGVEETELEEEAVGARQTEEEMVAVVAQVHDVVMDLMVSH